MPIYGYQKAKPVDYVADIRHAGGGTSWTYVRTTIGARATYGMIANHYEGDGKVVGFRHGCALTHEDHIGIRQGNPGLMKNHWFGYGERAA